MANDDFENQEEETPLIKRLREQLEEQGTALKTARSAERKLAFIEAGVDVTAKAGQLLMKSYDGDLSDIEALRTEAQELGVYRGSAPATEQQGAPQGAPQQQAGTVNLETGSTQRQEIANEAAAGGPQWVDPREEARAKYDEVIKAQGSQEDAGAAWLAMYAQRTARDNGLI